mgnify:CR=1 FL=1
MALSYTSEGGNFLPSGRRKLSAWIKDVVAGEGYILGEVSFVFCSAEYHIDINRRYLGHDYHTDVITFDYSDLDGTGVVSGDILIDPEQVAVQSKEWGATREEELYRVMVHGVLHLCGYGDKEPAEQEIMTAKEDHYLSKLSVSLD